MQGSGRIIIFVSLVIVQLTVLAQPKNTLPYKRCSVKTINFEQGLLNNATTNILTDVLGFTWISTKTGMQRFNGYTLETITPVAGKDTFKINYPVFFLALHDGGIWMSCKQGMLEYDPSSNSFKHVISIGSKGYSSSFPIIPIKETDEGTWCIQEGKGMVIYNRKGVEQPQPHILDGAAVTGIMGSTDLLFRNIVATNDRYIFIRGKADQIECIDTRDKTVKRIHFSGINIWAMAATQGSLYIISDQQLLLINIADGTTKKIINLKNILNENILTSSLWVKDNNQLLVNLNGHLYQTDTSCNFQNEFTDLGRNPIVPSGYIDRIYTDKFRRVWALTNNDIKRIENTQIPFAHLIYPNSKNNFVRTLYYDEQKHFVIAGCLNGGIQLYDTLSNPLWEKPLINTDIKNIISIEKLTDTDYLIITFGRGWFLLNVSTKQVRSFNLSAAMDEKIRSTLINFGNNIQRIDNTTVALSTSINVFRCVFSGNTLLSATPVIPFKNGVATINCFLYASDKTWWAGTLDGLLYRVDKDEHLQTIHVPENYLVRSITEDSTHNIWVGTDKVLCIYSAKGELIKRITKETGLLNDCIYALLPSDKQAAVFASSNLGISYISAEGTVNNYSKELGLQENEFNTGAAVKTSSGKFYFGGVNGITAFYPASLNVVSDTPIINITRLVVNDSLYNSSAGTWKGDSILLKYYQNHIQLDFAAMGLLNNNEYLYKYRLKGFEDAWQSTRQPIGIKYILEPGEYTFEISCNPILSTENSFTKKIVIIIYPPWWQAWWFRIAAFILIVGIIAFFIQQYNRRKYVQKIRALQIQHEIQSERERISRDLHDSLGTFAASIASNIEHVEIAGEDMTSATALQELRSNSQSIVSQLGDTIWALKKDALSLTAISDRLKVFLQKVQLSYPGIMVNISEQINIDRVLPASQAFHLLQIVQEAIINAVRHSQCDAIQLLIEGNEEWTISIADNGK